MKAKKHCPYASETLYPTFFLCKENKGNTAINGKSYATRDYCELCLNRKAAKSATR